MENSNETRTQTRQRPHVVVVPSPGMGHLIPLAEFARHLHDNHHFSITLLLPTTTPPTAAQTTYLTTLPSAVSYAFLPQVDPTLHLPATDHVAHEVIITIANRESAPHVREAVQGIQRRQKVAALVTDLFGTALFEMTRELGVLPYIYFTSTGMCLSFLLHLPVLDETVSCEYKDMVEPIVLPGCVPLHGRDFVDPVQDRKNVAYKVILDHIKKYNLAEGIFINTFTDLEPGVLRALKNNEYSGPRSIYPVGPIIQSGLGDGSDDGSDCISWLDRQPPGSVLFVSFGSGGTLTYKQLNELAVGLEQSGQKFLWVVRSPSNISYGSFFSGLSQDDPFGFLPNGYVDRIRDRGLLVPSWAPQIKVLAHRSTGGFLSHCGWNSTLESIVNGVPIVAWPLYAEQRMNAVMLSEGLKVAIRVKSNECGLVEANEISTIVRELMVGEEGKRINQRMKELSDCARKATSEDGESTKVLNQVVHKWTS